VVEVERGKRCSACGLDHHAVFIKKLKRRRYRMRSASRFDVEFVFNGETTAPVSRFLDALRQVTGKRTLKPWIVLSTVFFAFAAACKPIMRTPCDTR
jgi:hypothetical protein